MIHNAQFPHWSGAATTAKEAWISDVHINMLGRWKSPAYQLYIRTPNDQLAKISKQLASIAIRTCKVDEFCS